MTTEYDICKEFEDYIAAMGTFRQSREAFQERYGLRFKEAYQLLEQIEELPDYGEIRDYGEWEIVGQHTEYEIMLTGSAYRGDHDCSQHYISPDDLMVNWDNWKLIKEAKVKELRLARQREQELEKQATETRELEDYRKLHTKYKGRI